MGILSKLLKIQVDLKAPKGQYNSFGKYKYRNCEDILEAVKPLCNIENCVLTVSDDLRQVGDRYYIMATAILTDIETGEKIANSAFAREEESKKGMDGSQVTGASSSYARKYALNGLFAIDDTKDSDTTNSGSKQPPSPPKEYKCHDCSKAFESFVDKNGKTWSSGQVYHMSESKNTDKKARCSVCMKKAGTEIVK